MKLTLASQKENVFSPKDCLQISANSNQQSILQGPQKSAILNQINNNLYQFDTFFMRARSIQLDLLLKGEQSIQNICDQSILIIGPTRKGKSTLCNHLRDKPLIGKEDYNGFITYEPSDLKDTTYAQMGSSLSSVTLIPNIYSISMNSLNISLIDLAGFGENRSSAGAMAVSYFLSILFEKMKKVKFIIVLDQGIIYDTNISGLTNILNEFIGLFDFSFMRDTVKKNLISSISFVINRATKSKSRYINRLNSLAEMIEKDNNLNKIKNKYLIIELLSAVAYQQRVQDFPLANPQNMAPKCTILANLSNKKWDWFQLKSSKQQLRRQKPLVILPFQTDFQKLEQIEKENLKQDLSAYSQLLTKGFGQIIKCFRQQLVNNWNITVKSKNLAENIVVGNLLNSSAFFIEVDSFLQRTYQTYRIEGLSDNISLSKKQAEPNLLETINSTIQMFNVFSFNGVDFVTLSIEDKLKQLGKVIGPLVSNMVCICRNSSQYQKMKKLVFVIQRSIHEYLIFSRIKQDMLNDFHMKLHDCINTSLENKLDYLSAIFNSVNENMIRLLFNQIPKLTEFQKFIDIFMTQLPNNPNLGQVYAKNKSDYCSKYRKIKLDIGKHKLQISMSTQTALQSLKYLALLIQQINHFHIQIRNKNIAISSQEKFAKQYQLPKIKYTKIAASLIMKLNLQQYPQKSQLALDFSELSRCPYDTDKFYQQALAEQMQNPKDLIPILQKYYKFQLRWGRIEDAIQSVFRMQNIYMDLESYDSLVSVKDILTSIESNRQSYRRSYLSQINRINQPFDDSQEYKLTNLFMQASKKLRQSDLKILLWSPPKKEQLDLRRSMDQKVLKNVYQEAKKCGYGYVNKTEYKINPQKSTPLKPQITSPPTKRNNYVNTQMVYKDSQSFKKRPYREHCYQ